MRLTPRDMEMIKAVHDYRVLRGDQLQALFFGSQSTASYRLSRLYQHGFLDRHFLPTLGGPASSPTLYTVGKQGIQVLREVFEYAPEELKRRPSNKEFTAHWLEHLTKINDVRVAVTLAAQRHGYALETWLDDTALKATYDYVTIKTSRSGSRKVSLIPDGYFVLQVPRGRTCFFLELDRGTMTNSQFKTKILAYQAYTTSGQYQHRYGTTSLRVLTVAPGPKRLANLKRVTEDAGGGRIYWFAELPAITPETVIDVPIWHVAGDTARLPLIE
jgi:hypothetical protein